jgi:4-hydroxy-tetrahydrodipicolinate synthase
VNVAATFAHRANICNARNPLPDVYRRRTHTCHPVADAPMIAPCAQRTAVREVHEMGNAFRGSYTVTITPFTEDGRAVDKQAWRRFLDWQLDVGVPGVIVLGSTGEFLTVSDDERTQLVETAVRHVAGRIPVLVGTMNAHTPNAVRYSREAEALGADGLMIAPPYYYTPTEDEIFNYYRAIAEAVSLPIMLYNNPVTTNVDMSAKLVGRLTRAFDNVRYIKEASLDVARVHDVIEETDAVMNVFAGERIVESFLLGAVGYVNPYGNYIPRASYRIWDLLVDGRIDDAWKIERLINQIDHIIAEGHPTYGHQCYSKALAAVAGCPVGDVRAPLTRFEELGDEGQARVAAIEAHMRELEELVEALERAPALTA